MVLEEATSDGDAYGAAAPEGKIDPQRPTRYQVKFDELPKPVNIFMVPVRQDALVKQILQNCRQAEGALNRTLRQDEVDAIGYHFAKSLRTVSYGVPIGVLGGGLAAYRSMSTFRFPGYTPKPTFNPDVFGPIRGPMARSFWHVLRFQLYGAVGFVTGALFFGSYAGLVNSVEIGSDPRLQDYIKALQDRAQRHTGQMQPQGQRNPIMSQEGRMDQQAQRAAQRLGMEDAWKRQDIQRPARNYDDMSPTGGSWMDDYKQDPADTGLLTDQQMEARDRKDKSNAERAERVEQQRTAAANQARSQAQQADNADDASPMASPQPTQSSYPQGSSWERLRKEAAAGRQSSRSSPTNTPQVRTEQQDGSTLGDSFSFSSSNEERQLAQVEAQKEFDARVERERQGGDFNESNRGGWRR